MPKMKAKNLRAYAGKNLKLGDVFNAEDKDVRFLEQTGLAEKHKEEKLERPIKAKTPETTPPQYVARNLTAAPAEIERATYKRKDLTAE